MKKRHLLGLLLLPAICWTGCNSNGSQNEESAYVIKGDTVYVTNDNVLASKLVLSEVKIEPYLKEVVTAGTVQPIPTQFAYIAPPFPGRVIKSYVRLGQKVNVNTPLFEISSPDFTAVQKEYYQARSAKELAQKDLKRKQDLIKNGVGSQRELEEAENELSIAEKELENAVAALAVYHVNPDDMVFGQPLIVRSPIAGEVIENNIVTGQYIHSESDPIATVADLSQVWVAAQVKEKDIRFIHEGDDMDIHISALPGTTLKGTVYHVEESVDEETRSIKVLSVCDNKKGLLKIGMYTTVYFLDKPADFIHIPEKALLQGEKDSYVYVQAAPNTFVRTPVEIEVTKEGKAVISEGLLAGHIIISEGGYYLK